MEAPRAHDRPEDWDAVSQAYAEHIAPRLMRKYADAVLERLEPSDGHAALEVGAGSGALTEALFPHVRSLVATDFSPRMVEVLQARLGALGARNLRCAVMDGQDLQFDADSFDLAACHFALMLFPDRAKGFSELCRVVRPGGRVVVTAWGGPEEFEALGLLLAAMKRAFPDQPPPPTPPPVFSLSDPAAFRREMESAGLRDVRVDHVTQELEVEGFDDLWSLTTAGAPPVEALLERIGREGEAQLRECLRALVEARFGTGPFALTNVATVGSGTATNAPSP